MSDALAALDAATRDGLLLWRVYERHALKVLYTDAEAVRLWRQTVPEGERAAWVTAAARVRAEHRAEPGLDAEALGRAAWSAWNTVRDDRERTAAEEDHAWGAFTSDQEKATWADAATYVVRDLPAPASRALG